MTTATAKDWDIKPPPNHYTTIALDILLTEEKTKAIKMGYIPEEMEEKWFCYFEDNKLYQHRSWTGFCIDIIEFIQEGERLRAISAKVNRDQTQYTNRDDAEDTNRITEMLDWLYRG